MTLLIGVMSGTSMDGIDAVLARFPGDDSAPMAIEGHCHTEFTPSLRQNLMDLNATGPDELHRAALAANGVADAYAGAVRQLLSRCGQTAGQVRAIGAHGQTVRHRPGEFDGRGYTVQLLNGALLAELSGIDVVCDLRSRDVAAGGQGAPLVPAFHAALWATPGRSQAVLNVGGISNLSLLHEDGRVGGFDCGPGNALLDLWCERHQGTPFDDEGAWAASGAVSAQLLSRLLSDPYFDRSPPKSTGRDLFHAAWLDRILAESTVFDLPPEDVQATLVELTARSVARDLLRHVPGADRMLVCGGGALNRHLMRRLQALLPSLRVQPTDEVGLPALQVEAAAFAWLAQAHIEHLPGNRPEVTGARGLRVLGAHYPGR